MTDATRRSYRAFSRALWGLFLLAIAAVALVFFALSRGDLPTLTQLENPKDQLASTVYAADGTELGRYYVENRVAVPYAELNPHLVDALIATEDERYYEHSGIDWLGLARAVGRLGRDGGGSTITQQLAKQMFTKVASASFPERVKQKLKEWIISTRLERNYTKEEIVAMYFNIFEFNNGAFGVEAASEIYFSKNQSELTRDEAALLVGMFKSPTRYNPTRNPELSRKRREVVLKQMLRAGKIDEPAYDSLRARELGVRLRRQTHVDGLAPYFRMELRKEVRRILDDPAIVDAEGEPYDVNRDGLKIFTTIDPDMQALAERAAFEHMGELQAKYRAVWKGRDPWTYVDYEDGEAVTTPEELAYRARRLRQFVRETERYEAMRQRALGEVGAAVAEAYDGWEITPRDIDRLVRHERDGGVIAALKRTNSIGRTLEGRYRRLLDDDALWPRTKAAYLRLEREVDEVFAEPTRMTVFAYNDAQQTDTTMSPLDSIKYMRSFLQIGSMSVEPSTGYVRTWVGGVNHKWFPFDHVQTRRQVGSTFKPFIYATAISQQGIAPCYRVADLPQTIRVGESGFNLLDDWAPGNANGEFSGEYLTLMDALQKSKNSVSVYLMKNLGDTDPVRGLVHNMGIDSSARYRNGRYVVPESPSIALGATDLSVEEMSGAYTTWANNGVYVKPVIVRRIEDKNGKVLYQAIPEERTALDPVSNYTMLRMLQHAGRSYKYFGGVETAYGGKTGTTNDYVDGWYMGVTPNLVTGTWVGGDERYIRFLSLSNGQGGRMARPFFAKFLKALEANAEAVGFEKGAEFFVPPGASRVEFDCGEVPAGYAPANPFDAALAGADSTGAAAGGLPGAPDPFGGGFGGSGLGEGSFGDGGGFGGGGFGDDAFGGAGGGLSADDPFADEVVPPPAPADTAASPAPVVVDSIQ